MAGVSQDNEAAEKGPEGSSTEAVPGDTTISRVKLLDTIVDTFLQKLVAGKRRPSGIPEKDLCSVMAPYFLKQQDTLCRQVQKQEAKNQELAEAVLAGRRQVEELQQQVQAVQQTWQALHREQRELLSVLRAPE
ncbi:rCG62477, isoform CRA_b [Rattus norvegicus]|uniref:Polyamine-modulated factor 1 n=2 Tax=Rattus norvegicus TaxID=10116 RepID=A0A0U1RS22_RAT|nr:polyamine-modulated factor 1 isoform X1 [Rattus norvegicus]EDM00717.1 rCG62477, isoform CRA_b [Rattus norvegicus]|eukprot:XP_017446593.1 PREDICTED: polyamine-modulated factor 1 isoform X1 [Rattus norvegicus]